MKTKRILFSFLLVCCMLGIQAKTTYIPTYDNHLTLIENGEISEVKNQLHGASLTSKDGLLYCAIVQQVVSEDLVKAIKNAKSASGWAKVLGGVAAASEVYSDVELYRGRVNGGTIIGRDIARDAEGAAAAASAEAKAQAEELKTLLVDLLVQNHSDKEMLITDMDRGLVWFILPHSEMTIPLAKGVPCHFRVSSASPLDENVKYINANANSTLEKYTVGLETAEYWYVPMSEKAAKGLRFEGKLDDGYIRVNRKDLTMAAVSKEEFRKIKEANKD